MPRGSPNVDVRKPKHKYCRMQSIALDGIEARTMGTREAGKTKIMLGRKSILFMEIEFNFVCFGASLEKVPNRLVCGDM